MQPQYIARQQAHARLRLLKDAQNMSVSEACRKHGYSRTCYYKWAKRYDGSLQSLMDRSRKPHSHPQQLSAEEHALINRVARAKSYTDKHGRKRTLGLYRLHWLLRVFHGFTRSVHGLYKALKRLGFYGPAKRRRRRKYQRYERPWPGANIQIDIKYLDPIAGRKEYQYSAIDEYSRLLYARIYDHISVHNTKRFLGDALDFFEKHRVRVRQVQTDHGSEFTYAMLPHVVCQHPFEQALQDQAIVHKLTPIGKPHLQGKVERLHRIADEEFHDRRHFRSCPQRRRAFAAWVTYYNHRRPHGSLNWNTPVQQLQHYCQTQSVNYV